MTGATQDTCAKPNNTKKKREKVEEEGEKESSYSMPCYTQYSTLCHL